MTSEPASFLRRGAPRAGTAELVWTFTDDASLDFACNLPDLYDVGMFGRIEFRK